MEKKHWPPNFWKVVYEYHMMPCIIVSSAQNFERFWMNNIELDEIIWFRFNFQF